VTNITGIEGITFSEQSVKLLKHPLRQLYSGFFPMQGNLVAAQVELYLECLFNESKVTVALAAEVQKQGVVIKAEFDIARARCTGMHRLGQLSIPFLP
jgi:hypothetical protein